ncbi:MAG: hypothetical protein JWO20_2567 [Candidatus Angelobacter sp.]|jgi:hypothetical protein|nr:hypothetical protein [Candidatus Angelobacter sp.]
MNGLDPKIDLTFLLNRMLQSVKVANRDVILKFDANVEIHIESRLVHKGQNYNVEWSYGAEWHFRPLLGTQVIGIKAEPSGTLSLSFSNRDSLTIFDDNADYESYTISSPGQTIVV